MAYSASSFYFFWKVLYYFEWFGQGCDLWPLCPNFWFQTPAKFGVTLRLWRALRKKWTLNSHIWGHFWEIISDKGLGTQDKCDILYKSRVPVMHDVRINRNSTVHEIQWLLAVKISEVCNNFLLRNCWITGVTLGGEPNLAKSGILNLPFLYQILL